MDFADAMGFMSILPISSILADRGDRLLLSRIGRCACNSFESAVFGQNDVRLLGLARRFEFCLNLKITKYTHHGEWQRRDTDGQSTYSVHLIIIQFNGLIRKISCYTVAEKNS